MAGWIEIIDAYKIEDNCFSVISLTLNGETFTLRFGVHPEEYSRLRYIITFRPFENTSVGKYRYFTLGNGGKDEHSKNFSLISIRVDQLKQTKQFMLPIGPKYLANIWWFREIKDRKISEPFLLEPPTKPSLAKQIKPRSA